MDLKIQLYDNGTIFKYKYLYRNWLVRANSEILIGKQFVWQTVLVLRATGITLPKS